MESTIFISAGEASGEHYGALLVNAFRQRLSATGRSAHFIGMGGERMKAAGLERIVRAEDMAVMGITEVVHHLPRIYREFRKLKQAIRTHRPDVAVLIDFPDIHFRLAKEFHRLGIPVVFFVSPQLWAWKKARIKLVQKYIDRMLVIFPFEEQFYRDHGVKAEFVGHPLAETDLPTITRGQFAQASGLNPAKTWIALLPGSRPKEIRDNLPEMLKAAHGLAALADTEGGGGFNPRIAQTESMPALAAERRLPPISSEAEPSSATPLVRERAVKGTGFSQYINSLNSSEASAPEGCTSSPSSADACEFILPLAATLNTAQRQAARELVETHRGNLTVRLVNDISGAEGAVGPTAGGARAALLHARASIVASGTATVEAALIGNPFVVVYRVSPVTYAIARRVVKVPHVAMANLIAGKRVVPELIQNDFTASNIVRELQRLLPDGPPRQSMMKELAEIRGLLSAGVTNGNESGAIGRVAEVTLELLETTSPAGVAETVHS